MNNPARAFNRMDNMFTATAPPFPISPSPFSNISKKTSCERGCSCLCAYTVYGYYIHFLLSFSLFKKIYIYLQLTLDTEVLIQGLGY